MFRDRDEELKRLQAELLEEEEQETAEEEYLQEDVEQLLEDEEKVSDPDSYRNFATGYKAYNTDRVDEDLDDLSDAVLHGPDKKKGGCLAVVFLLLTALLLAILWLVAKKEGLV